MPAKLVKTEYPGIFKRGNRYAVIYRGSDGRQRQESAPTKKAARLLKGEREKDASRGINNLGGDTSFRDYALDWVASYQGRGRHGFREQSRRSYRRALELYAIPFLYGRRHRDLAQITPRTIAQFVGWLCDDQEQGEHRAQLRRRELELAGRYAAAEAVVVAPVHLADSTVRGILAPVRSCLASAMREGLIQHNPTAGASLPARDALRAAQAGEDDEPERRALTRPELATLIQVAPPRLLPLIRLLAGTGLRISEALALRWQDVALDGSQPAVRVRRAYVKGTFGPPKSKYGRRDVPIGHEIVLCLRQLHGRTEWSQPGDLVFCDAAGDPLHASNLSYRMLKPVAEEAGVGWMGWHTLRHTCASMLFARGANAVQVQRWLGHHSPAFTLSTYVHLLEEDLGLALDLAAETAQGASKVPAGHP